SGELITADVSGEGPAMWITLRALPSRARKTYFVISLTPMTKETRLLHNAREMGQRVQNLYRTLADVRAELFERTLQLGEQKNRMLAILRGMGDGLLVFDDRGRVIQYNEVAREILNLPGGDLDNEPVYALCPELGELLGISSENPQAPLRLTHEENFTVGKRELRASIAPLFDNRDRYLGLVMILQDRTKQAEVDRMKSDLISIVSHELRSPLTSIKGYVDLMISGDLGPIPPEQKKYLEIVLNNANRLATLIDDMLDLSRIESGKLTMTFGKVEIKYLCDFVYLTFKPQAALKSITFELQGTDGLAVSGDVERLRQALTNLVSNAIKYTPEEGSVKISAYRQDRNVCIDVTDTGFGISPENQKRLFQKFFRVKDKKTRNIGGTGLGLCITKSIIEAHEGQILVKSQEEEGSTFTIQLPEYHG
ncbi:MAG: ATP-binding protein, partial [bacterium]